MIDKLMGVGAVQQQGYAQDPAMLRNAAVQPPKQPSAMQSAERLHTGLERLTQALSNLENHLAPVLVCVPETLSKEGSQERTGITLVDIIDDAARRAYALASRVDAIGQRAAV